MLGIPFHQSAAELREHGEVEARVGQFETQGILPVYAGTDGFCRLPIGESPSANCIIA